MKSYKNNKKIGELGEDFAAAILGEEGYEILQRNFTCKYGEIDIIARKDETICFIEVKTRTTEIYGTPAEAVNKGKRHRISIAAKYFLSITKWHYKEVDFQVMEITVNQITGLIF